jgi:hypothetical protein
VQINFGAVQLLEDYINHWENGWFQLRRSWHFYFDPDRLKWFHPMLEEHITKELHLYQQQAWLETYESIIRRRIHDRDRVTQQRLHTIDEYFPPLPDGTANQ